MHLAYDIKSALIYLTLCVFVSNLLRCDIRALKEVGHKTVPKVKSSTRGSTRGLVAFSDVGTNDAVRHEADKVSSKW